MSEDTTTETELERKLKVDIVVHPFYGAHFLRQYDSFFSHLFMDVQDLFHAKAVAQDDYADLLLKLWKERVNLVAEAEDHVMAVCLNNNVSRDEMAKSGDLGLMAIQRMRNFQGILVDYAEHRLGDRLVTYQQSNRDPARAFLAKQAVGYLAAHMYGVGETAAWCVRAELSALSEYLKYTSREGGRPRVTTEVLAELCSDCVEGKVDAYQRFEAERVA
jgi:hypothetical protein